MPKFDIESAGDSKPRMEQRWIWLNQIEPDEFNGEIYNVTGIEALAEDIRLNGLLQFPLVRYMPGGKYMIISGHRRVQAIRLLAREAPEEWKTIPVILDPEQDETAAHIKLISANAVNRELSPGEIMKQTLKMHELLSRQKEKENLSGRVRDMVAKKLNMSVGTVGEYMAINGHLELSLQEKFFEGVISKAVAVELSKLDAAAQLDWLGKLEDGKNFTAEDIRAYRRQLEQEAIEVEHSQNNVSDSDTDKVEDKNEEYHEDKKDMPGGDICGNAEDEYNERLQQDTQADAGEDGQGESQPSEGSSHCAVEHAKLENMSESDTQDSMAHDLAWYQDMIRVAVVDVAIACKEIRELGHGCSDCPLCADGWCTNKHFEPKNVNYMLIARKRDDKLDELFMEQDW